MGAVTENTDFADKGRWAPDGRTIYFVSNRGASLNVWGRRFDPIRGQPDGEAFPITHFVSPEQVLLPRMGPLGLAVSRHRLVIPIASISGNAWVLDNPGS